MKKILAIAIGLLSLSCSGQEVSTAQNGMNLSTTDLTKEQTEIIYKQTNSFPNKTQLSIAIIKAGKIEFVGIERENDTIQLTENYKKAFEIGSITKVFTATLLSDLVVEQKIKLEDPIQDYLEFNLNTEHHISFKQLANHTSGLPRLPSNMNFWSVDPNNPYANYSEKKLVNYLSNTINFLHEPKTTYEYSNLGAGLLGFTLAKYSKSTYETLLQEKVFKSHQMNNSTSQKENLQVELVQGLTPKGKNATNWDFNVLAGAGAIFSNTEDLSKFALAQFDETNEVLQLTHQPTFKINERMSIGLGWHLLQIENNELLWHNGGTGGYSSSIALDVENKNGIVILSNVSAQHQNMNNIDQLGFELIETLIEK